MKTKYLKIMLAMIVIIIFIILGLLIYYLLNNMQNYISLNNSLTEENDKLTNQILELNNKIDYLSNSTLANEASNTLLENKISNITNENTTNNEINQKIILTENKTVEDAISNYFKIKDLIESDSLNLLYNLKLINPKNDDGEFEDITKENTIAITNINYEDFENAISNYMTLKLFNQEFANTASQNSDNTLCFIAQGGSSLNPEILKIEYITDEDNKTTPICDVTVKYTPDESDGFYEYTYTISLIKQNGYFVISNISLIEE